MKIPLQITFRDMESTGALKTLIQDKAADLDKFCSDLMSCRVVIEAPHQHHRKGQLYRVRIDMTVPRQELVVGRSPDLHGAHEDLHVAIRDAFRAARRELQDYMRRRRGDVKTQVTPPHGIVSKLFLYEGYGFIMSFDGREIYFHRNSVVGEFAALELGAEVRFAEEIGDNGPQASTVAAVGKSGRVVAPRP
jgi:cold shock CspA family protein/ribosome-associated translation inhibitor RaiA